MVLEKAVAVTKCNLAFVERFGLLPGVFDESASLQVRRNDEILLPLHFGDTITHISHIENDANKAMMFGSTHNQVIDDRRRQASVDLQHHLALAAGGRDDVLDAVGRRARKDVQLVQLRSGLGGSELSFLVGHALMRERSNANRAGEGMVENFAADRIGEVLEVGEAA